MSDGDTGAEERPIRALDVVAYQCVGEGPTRVFWLWVKGQLLWTMPTMVVWPHSIADLLNDPDGEDPGYWARRRTLDQGKAVAAQAYDVDRHRYVTVWWDEKVAKPRYVRWVAQGMPDSEGIWI